MPAIPRPSRRKLFPWMLLAAVAYVVSPVDLVPDFIPGLGLGDDAMVLLALVAQALTAYLAPRTAARPRPF